MFSWAYFLASDLPQVFSAQAEGLLTSTTVVGYLRRIYEIQRFETGGLQLGGAHGRCRYHRNFGCDCGAKTAAVYSEGKAV
jgi:hypothetical protein